jgi:hypothetical protein
LNHVCGRAWDLLEGNFTAMKVYPGVSFPQMSILVVSLFLFTKHFKSVAGLGPFVKPLEKFSKYVKYKVWDKVQPSN